MAMLAEAHPRLAEKFPELASAKGIRAEHGNLEEAERALEVCPTCPGLDACPFAPRGEMPYAEPVIVDGRRITDAQGNWLVALHRQPCRHEIARRREQTVARLVEEAGLPNRFLGWTFDALDQTPAVATAKKWVEALPHTDGYFRAPLPGGIKNPMLLLVGPVGVGKTSVAVAIAKAAIERTLSPLLWWSAPLLVDALRAQEVRILEVAYAPALVLDDLGAGEWTPWAVGEFEKLLDYRYQHQLATVVTSNLEPEPMTRILGARITSRLSEANVIVLAGKDRRMRPRKLAR